MAQLRIAINFFYENGHRHARQASSYHTGEEYSTHDREPYSGSPRTLMLRYVPHFMGLAAAPVRKSHLVRHGAQAPVSAQVLVGVQVHDLVQYFSFDSQV